MSLRLKIERKRIRNRDVIALDRLQHAETADLEELCRFMARFMVDEHDQPLPTDEAFEALLDMPFEETQDAINRMGDEVMGQKEDAVPPTNAEPS